MCGIVGYIGSREAVPLIVDGLRRLEYRGYDSAGVAVLNGDNTLEVRRASGKLRNLEDVIRNKPLSRLLWHRPHALGHARPPDGRKRASAPRLHGPRLWSFTTGSSKTTWRCASNCTAEGHTFKTETDTEIIAHLVEKYLDGCLEQAVRSALKEIHGVFAISVIASSDPHKIVAARSGPPVVIGLGQDEFFVASDVPAILSHTRDMFFLNDGDVAILTPEGVRLTDFDGKTVRRQVSRILWDPVMAEKGGYKHFMLKEIFEQPRAVKDTMLGRVGLESGRVFLDEVDIPEADFRSFQQVKIVACGTSWHAGLAGKFIIERLARIPVEVDYGSEFRYRDPIIPPNTLTVVISQSGETADTLGRPARGQIEGFEDARDLQRSRLHDHPRSHGTFC